MLFLTVSDAEESNQITNTIVARRPKMYKKNPPTLQIKPITGFRVLVLALKIKLGDDELVLWRCHDL